MGTNLKETEADRGRTRGYYISPLCPSAILDNLSRTSGQLVRPSFGNSGLSFADNFADNLSALGQNSGPVVRYGIREDAFALMSKGLPIGEIANELRLKEYQLRRLLGMKSK